MEDFPNRRVLPSTTVLYRVIVLALILINALLELPVEDCEIVDIHDEAGPSFEVVLFVNGSDVLRVAGFRSIQGGYDVVAGIAENVLLPHYVSTLRAAVRQLESVKRWEQVDTVRAFSPGWNEESENS